MCVCTSNLHVYLDYNGYCLCKVKRGFVILRQKWMCVFESVCVFSPFRVFGGTPPSSTVQPTSSFRPAKSFSISSQGTRTYQSNVGQISSIIFSMITNYKICWWQCRCGCDSNVCGRVQSADVSGCEGTTQRWSRAHWGTFTYVVVFYKRDLHIISARAY